MKDLYDSRPFKIRNADEYDLSQILTLFVNPLGGLVTPFDYENSIVKGRMGSGKTMYLRANHAYYLYNIVPCLLSGEELVLPVMIRLSDFQHQTEPTDIYKSIIVRIIEELSSIYMHLQDAKKLACIHIGIKSMPSDIFFNQRFSNSMKELSRLEADEYIERITNDLGLRGGIKPKFFEISGDYRNTHFVEVKKKSNPGIKDIEECYKNLLEHQDGKILLLIDEAAALDRKFFRGSESNSFFEILMNQFRTASYIRTKIAIYPNSFQDILTETRYGDNIILEESILDEAGYERMRQRSHSIIKNYLKSSGNATVEPEDVFALNTDNNYGDCLEQLINGSNGNIRRLIQLLDTAMITAFYEHGGTGKITLQNAFDTLGKHSQGSEDLFTVPEREFLDNIAKACKARSTYRFQFPNMSPILSKYTSKSQEYNIINVIEVGTGRRSTTYAFDYCYCTAHEIPTHYYGDAEKISKDRTLLNGRWINRVARITDEIIEQANVPGKIEGAIDWLREKKGFIRGDDGKYYYMNDNFILDADVGKSIYSGRRVRFFPSKLGDSDVAYSIELL